MFPGFLPLTTLDCAQADLNRCARTATSAQEYSGRGTRSISVQPKPPSATIFAPLSYPAQEGDAGDVLGSADAHSGDHFAAALLDLPGGIIKALRHRCPD